MVSQMTKRLIVCIWTILLIQSTHMPEGGRFFGELPGGEAASRGAVEPRTDRSPDREGAWLEGLGITVETIERYQRMPLYEGASTEYVIWQALLARLVEGGAGMSPQAQQRLRNLTGIFGIVAFPNMTASERGFREDLARESEIGPGLVYEVTPDVGADLRTLWNRFGLRVPREGMGAELLGRPASTLRTQPTRPQLPSGK